MARSSNMMMPMMMMMMCMASCMMSMMGMGPFGGLFSGVSKATKPKLKKNENLTNALRSMAAAKKLCQKCQTANWEGTTGVGADSPCADMKQNCIDEGLPGEEEQVLSGGFQGASFSEAHQMNCNKCQQTNWEGSLPAFGSTIPCSEIKADCM